ncbi:MAG TPA: hypothetical protein VFJ51_10060 [Nitrososphaeraceae archaeon]|nr:hypothetical protein [Nitrososphaeraceae archaeon]
MSEGQSEQDIVEGFEGNERRVSLWIAFALDTHLLEQDISGKWMVSDKGRSWIGG